MGGTTVTAVGGGEKKNIFCYSLQFEIIFRQKKAHCSAQFLLREEAGLEKKVAETERNTA